MVTARCETESQQSTGRQRADVLAQDGEALQPVDPTAKSVGVFNVYLHAGLVHFPSIVGAQYSTVNIIFEDNTEETRAALNRCFNARTNNLSWGQSFVINEALRTVIVAECLARKTISQMMFAESIAVCQCVIALMPSTEEAFNTVARHAAKDRTQSVERYQCPIGPRDATTEKIFNLPHAVRGIVLPILDDGNAPTMEAV